LDSGRRKKGKYAECENVAINGIHGVRDPLSKGVIAVTTILAEYG
jgi:hypothetical protein